MMHPHTMILLEEYRALYQLAEFRLGSLERRAMLGWGGIAAYVAAVGTATEVMAWSLAWCVPITLVWLLRTTINHARSFEDVLRRLEEIEQRVNQLLGADLLQFQSRHPSRQRTVGGRTGEASVHAVAVTCYANLMIAGEHAASLLSNGVSSLDMPILKSPTALMWGVYATLLALWLGWELREYWRYRYVKKMGMPIE
jgi:hypothetical protein